MTYIIHNEGDLQIYFCMIFLETRHHARARVTSGALIDCAFFGRENTDTSGFGLKISLASACYGDSRVAKQFLRPKLVFQPIGGLGRSWLFPASSIKFLTRRSLKSRWVYLAPHEDNSIQLLSTVRSRKWKNNFVVHLKVRRLIE